jgi:hypothetical protein
VEASRIVLLDGSGANFRDQCNETLGTLRGSCGENSIPDFWRPVVFDAKLSEFELTFPDPMYEFNAGDGDRGALKALQSEHWTQTKFDRPVILLDQIVQIFR